MRGRRISIPISVGKRLNNVDKGTCGLCSQLSDWKCFNQAFERTDSCVSSQFMPNELFLKLSFEVAVICQSVKLSIGTGKRSFGFKIYQFPDSRSIVSTLLFSPTVPLSPDFTNPHSRLHIKFHQLFIDNFKLVITLILCHSKLSDDVAHLKYHHGGQSCNMVCCLQQKRPPTQEDLSESPANALSHHTAPVHARRITGKSRRWFTPAMPREPRTHMLHPPRHHRRLVVKP
jgi:hypothetical protein